MLNKILKEYKRFIKKEFRKIVDSSSWHKKNELLEEIFEFDIIAECKEYKVVWKKYLDENAALLNIKLDNLKKDLDKESYNLIDLVYRRITTIFPCIDEVSLFYTRKADILTESEIQYKNYKIDGILPAHGMIVPEESVFHYHSGLKCLSANILDRIKNTDFIDGGAFIGDSAFTFVKYNPKRIFAFEPSDENFANMKKNISLEKFDELIIPVKKGVFSKTGNVSVSGENLCFFIDDENLNNAENKETIEVVSLDDFVEENNLNVGLIKLDVEGVESDVINGALNTIKKFKPVLLISIYHNPKDFFEIKPLIESLDLGYNFMIKKLNNRRLIAETMLIAY